MNNIIQPIDKEILKSELTSDIFIRPTNNANNEIYIFNGNLKPNLLKEVGRLREISFRLAGGGTGKEMDLDEFDTGPFSYQQLIVWNPNDEAIVGGYRLVFCRDNKDKNGNYILSTSEILQYSEKLKTDYFPYTIELGRSFVQPEYQPSQNSRKGIFSLDNLWDGLGALIVDHPEFKYFFGKITMYTNFNKEARDLILGFMEHFFPDPDQLTRPVHRISIENDISKFIQEIKDLEYKAAYNLLSQKVRNLGENVPPLFNNYMSLSPTMKTFGTSVNDHFGSVEETGILITIADIFESKKDRHVQSYLNWKAENRGQK